MKAITDVILVRPLLNNMSIVLVLLLLLPANSIAQDQDLLEAQQFLQEKGFDPGPADGLMGPQTRNAIKAFQTGSGLADTGELDQATLAAIRAFSEHEEEVRFVQKTENRNESAKDFEIKVVTDPDIAPGENIGSESAQSGGTVVAATSPLKVLDSGAENAVSSGTQYLWNILGLVVILVLLISLVLFLLRFRRETPEKIERVKQIRIEPTLSAAKSQFAADSSVQDELVREPPKLFRDPDEIKLENNA